MKQCHKCHSRTFYNTTRQDKFGTISRFEKCLKCGEKQKELSNVKDVTNFLLKSFNKDMKLL
jgi:hypothetical protein